MRPCSHNLFREKMRKKKEERGNEQMVNNLKKEKTKSKRDQVRKEKEGRKKIIIKIKSCLAKKTTCM